MEYNDKLMINLIIIKYFINLLITLIDDEQIISYFD